MTFPDSKYESIATFFDAYAGEVEAALRSVNRQNLEAAQILLSKALERDAQVFSCGNGGSAAISNHLVCDHVKGVQTDTDLSPRVHSLSSSMELVTAIANDMSYADVFSYQLATFGRPGDVLITISSSGDSENIVRAVEWAKAHGIATIAMTGFEGGRSARMADINLHVASSNYGILEDVHQTLMHVLAQYLRQSRMPAELVAQRKF